MRVMPIIRSRTGCFTCRRRKKKCNEEKPICSGCKRNKLDCRWPTESSSTSQIRTDKISVSRSPSDAARRLERHSMVAASMSPEQQPEKPHEQYQRIEAAPELTSIALTQPETHPTPDVFYMSPDAGPDSDADVEDVGEDPESRTSRTSSTSSHSTTNSSDDPQQLDYAGGVSDQLALINSGIFFDETSSLQHGIPMPMTLLPSHSPHSYDLLGYYLARTANSMGNGSTDVNPFVAKFIPLAFSNPLVLQLILAQSAAHRQASKEAYSSHEVAQRYYTDSVRMFRKVVGEYVSGKDDNTLTLTVGSLILCLTEVARGDVCGTIFDHLTASKSLLTALLDRPKVEASDDLPEFLVEYYMHMTASSMISTDLSSNSQPLMSPSIEAMARALVDRKYIGQLCGCWLELLLLIPQIFQLGQSMMTPLDGEPHPPSADDIITFGFLQSQILAFFPLPLASPFSQLAGLVFKQGVLLYLWSLLGTPQQGSSNTAHRDLMEGAVSEAISLLSQFPASIRVNTSLCWPLAVIGCCTSDLAVQEVLRERLQTMIDTIGLGNMRETLVLLEHVWRQPAEETSPWTLRKAMQEHQIWISFA